MDRLGIKRVVLCIAILVFAGLVVLFKYMNMNDGSMPEDVIGQSYTDDNEEVFDADKWGVFEDRSAEDIVSKYNEMIKPVDEEYIYELAPETEETYNIGRLSESAKDAVISGINYYRWLAGIKEAVVSDERCTDIQAAVFYDVLKTKDKTIQESCLKNMEPSVYKLCTEVIPDSIVKPTTVNTAVRDSMCGGMVFNSDGILKSRLSVLSYKTDEIAIGYYSGTFAVSGYDKSDDNMVYAFSSYPSPGLFPANDIDKELSAWHIELNSGMIIYDNKEEIQVRITDATDGTVYVRKQGDGLYVKDGLLVFYPPKENGGMFKHEYKVEVFGVKTISEKSAVIKYSVKFFDRNDYVSSKIVSVKNNPELIYAPKEMPDLLIEKFFADSVTIKLESGKEIEGNVLSWAHSVSGNEGLAQDKYIAVIDNSYIGKYIKDTDYLLGNISVKIVKYEDELEVVSSKAEDGGIDLSIVSDIEDEFSKISWYMLDGETYTLQFVETAEVLHINDKTEKTYIAAVESGTDESVLYLDMGRY